MLPIYAFVFLIACLVAYWRTLWFGKKYHVLVAFCSLLNTASMVGIGVMAAAVWHARSWQSFGLLTVSAAGYLLTEWWSLWLNRQQEAEKAAIDRRVRL